MTEVWFIHGNHDTDSDDDYDNLFNSVLADKNLLGRVVEVERLQIAGLGGVFHSQVWGHRVNGCMRGLKAWPLMVVRPINGGRISSKTP